MNWTIKYSFLGWELGSKMFERIIINKLAGYNNQKLRCLTYSKTFQVIFSILNKFQAQGGGYNNSMHSRMCGPCPLEDGKRGGYRGLQQSGFKISKLAIPSIMPILSQHQCCWLSIDFSYYYSYDIVILTTQKDLR